MLFRLRQTGIAVQDPRRLRALDLPRLRFVTDFDLDIHVRIVTLASC
jgi:hypothetical protein